MNTRCLICLWQVNVLGQKFFAFSKFKGGQSQCKQTWPGWFHDNKNPDAQKWGCYTGNKVSDSLREEHRAVLTQEERDTHLSLLQISLPDVEQPQYKAYSKPVPAQDRKFQPEHEMIKRINAKATTWKAKHYPEFEKLTVGEFNRKAGFRPSRHVNQRLPHASEVLLQELETEISDLPANFDWRNKDGQNFVDPVVDQGSCGSCYAVSTTSMINSRVRIMTKNREKPRLPWGQILQCDRYNQGCAGGYPFLVEKYTQDFGLTKSGKCAASREELSELGEGTEAGRRTPYVRVKSYGYIGGYYGGTKTAQMMREIYKNGPIVVGINGGYELMMSDRRRQLFEYRGEETKRDQERF